MCGAYRPYAVSRGCRWLAHGEVFYFVVLAARDQLHPDQGSFEALLAAKRRKLAKQRGAVTREARRKLASERPAPL